VDVINASEGVGKVNIAISGILWTRKALL